MNIINTKGDRNATRTHNSEAIAARNELLAAQVISVALTRTHDHPIHTDIARLIAAAIHCGSRSALARFAATGRLNTIEATKELAAIDPFGTPQHWRVALEHYLQSRRRP